MLTKRLFLIFIAFLIIPFFVSADGGIFPPPDYYIHETDQKAVIFYENGLETLILSVTFRGDAEDFGWVIPTPSRPQVSKSSDELFASLEQITTFEEDLVRPLTFEEAYNLGKATQSVHIIETKKIEYYEVAVLTADEPEALAEWLAVNDYQFPKKASYILDSYIENNWYFVAVKIDTEAISPGVDRQLRQGHMIPLELKFSTDKIVYPLKITSTLETIELPKYYLEKESFEPRRMSAPYYPLPSEVGILIYVFTPANKQAIPGFKTQYAGWLKKETIEELAFDDNGSPWLEVSQNKYFLTKLSHWMSYAEMTHDLYLRDASDNNLVNASPLEEPGKFWFWLVISISLVFIFWTGTIFVYLSKSR